MDGSGISNSGSDGDSNVAPPDGGDAGGSGVVNRVVLRDCNNIANAPRIGRCRTTAAAQVAVRGGGTGRTKRERMHGKVEDDGTTGAGASSATSFPRANVPRAAAPCAAGNNNNMAGK